MIEIRSGGYDYVVLQEQSTLPIKNATRMHENVELFDQLVKKGGSKTARSSPLSGEDHFAQ